MAAKQLKEFNSREFSKILQDNGFKYDHCTGSHRVWKRGDETAVINLKLNKMVARRLIKQHNLRVR